MEFKLSDIPAEEVYGLKLTMASRQEIVKFELNDFEQLNNLEFLTELKNLIINRYKLEKRNSINKEVDKKFSKTYDAINELNEFIESQTDFYKKRISKLTIELEKYND